MSKYYKKNNKKSFMTYSDTVSYPNNPLLYTYHKKERLRKKFLNYEWWNEELSDYLYSSIDDINLVPKEHQNPERFGDMDVPEEKPNFDELMNEAKKIAYLFYTINASTFFTSRKWGFK